MVCSLLAPPDLCVVATCSRSMKRVARADHVWRPLTARRFTCAGDLRRAGSSSLALSGFQEYSRLARIWHHPDRASSEPPPGMDAYSVILEIKIDGKRVAGGVYELDIISDGPWEGRGFGFYDLDPAGLLAPSALEAGALVERMSVSICVVRKSDKKCLHLITDICIDDADDDYVFFDSYNFVQGGSSSFNNVDRDYQHNTTHDFRLWGAVWNEPGDVLRGFTSPHGELRLWDPDDGALPTETILKRWHASKNWV